MTQPTPAQMIAHAREQMKIMTVREHVFEDAIKLLNDAKRCFLEGDTNAGLALLVDSNLVQLQAAYLNQKEECNKLRESLKRAESPILQAGLVPPNV